MKLNMFLIYMCVYAAFQQVNDDGHTKNCVNMSVNMYLSDQYHIEFQGL